MALGVPLFNQTSSKSGRGVFGTVQQSTPPRNAATQTFSGEQIRPGPSGIIPNAPTQTFQGEIIRPGPSGILPYEDPVEKLRKQLQEGYTAAAAPMLAGLQNQTDALEQRRRDLEAAYGARAGAAGSGADIANRGVDLDEEKLRLERQGTERQIPFLDQLLGLRSGKRASDRDYLKSLEGLSDQELALKLFGADAQQEFGLASADLAQKTLTRKQRSDATAAGAVVTQGNRDALGDIDTEHATTTKKVRSDRELAGKTAQLERERDAAGIKAQWDDNYWAEEIDKATTAEDKAKITDRLGALDLAAKELGLRREQIANSLAQSLASMGLDKIMSVGSLMDAMMGNDEKAAQAAWDIFQQSVADSRTLAGG